MLPQLLFPSHSSHNCFIPRASQHCDLNWPVMLRCYPHVRPGGGRGYFLAPWQWFISLHQMENILIESLQLQEQPPQKQRHRKLFRVQIGNLSVVVNNFLSCCSRFVHLWPGQGPGPVTSRCHCRVASPVCLLTVVWKSMWWSSRFCFYDVWEWGWARAICYWIRTITDALSSGR